MSKTNEYHFCQKGSHNCNKESLIKREEGNLEGALDSRKFLEIGGQCLGTREIGEVWEVCEDLMS